MTDATPSTPVAASTVVKSEPKPAAKKAKKAAPKKVAAKPAEKRKEPVVRNAKSLGRKPGPAMVALKNKIKLQVVPGECRFRGCSKKTIGTRAKWCLKHKKAIRKFQLKENNKVWNKKVKEGKADHHVVYRGHATVWALQNKEKAIRKVKMGVSIIPTVKELEAAFRKTPAAIKEAVRRG
jgi:hypothetical protein